MSDMSENPTVDFRKEVVGESEPIHGLKNMKYGGERLKTSSFVPTPDPDRFLRYAKQFVIGANAVETAETDEEELEIEELYIVWWTYILCNWKAMISTTRDGDGLYFEVTHNETKEETYVDIYKKQANHVFSHHDH